MNDFRKKYFLPLVQISTEQNPVKQNMVTHQATQILRDWTHTNFSSRLFKHSFSSIWNAIDPNLKLSKFRNIFKKSVKYNITQNSKQIISPDNMIWYMYLDYVHLCWLRCPVSLWSSDVWIYMINITCYTYRSWNKLFIYRAEEMWQYLEHTAAPWLHQYEVFPLDTALVLIGPGRLRQIRSTSGVSLDQCNKPTKYVTIVIKLWIMAENKSYIHHFN
jgi:hypothetical protein